MLTQMLMNSGLDQAMVLATSDEAPPSIIAESVKFLSLVENTKSREALVCKSA